MKIWIEEGKKIRLSVGGLKKFDRLPQKKGADQSQRNVTEKKLLLFLFRRLSGYEAEEEL